LLQLLDVVDQCKAEHEAIAAARAYILKKRAEILKELEGN
jgi:hypothetical protein